MPPEADATEEPNDEVRELARSLDADGDGLISDADVELLRADGMGADDIHAKLEQLAARLDDAAQVRELQAGLRGPAAESLPAGSGWAVVAALAAWLWWRGRGGATARAGGQRDPNPADAERLRAARLARLGGAGAEVEAADGASGPSTSAGAVSPEGVPAPGMPAKIHLVSAKTAAAWEAAAWEAAAK